ARDCRAAARRGRHPPAGVGAGTCRLRVGVMSERTIFALGAVCALIAVAAGAFGAHALAERLTPDRLATFETGARYQMYHAFALIAAAWAVGRWPGSMAGTAAVFFLVGIVVFSGT